MRYPWHRIDLPWADAVIDLSYNPDFVPLPETLPSPVPRRSIRVGDWTFTPHVVPGGPKGGSVSVLVLRAPDGWTGAVCVTQHSGTNRFAFSRFKQVLPYLGRLLSPGNTTEARLRHIRAKAVHGLPMLRVAMGDPPSWDPAHYEDDLCADNTEYMIMWASCGVGVVDADVLEDHSVKPVDPAPQPKPVDPTRGTRRLDLLTWDKHGFGNAHEVALWHRALVREPQEAKWLQEYGFTAESAFEWDQTPLTVLADPEHVREFAAAGWTPAALRELRTQVLAAPNKMQYGFYLRIHEWAHAMPPARASLYLCAGIGLEEAAALEEDAAPELDEQLQVLTGLRETRRGNYWRLQPSEMGKRMSPFHPSDNQSDEASVCAQCVPATVRDCAVNSRCVRLARPAR